MRSLGHVAPCIGGCRCNGLGHSFGLSIFNFRFELDRRLNGGRLLRGRLLLLLDRRSLLNRLGRLLLLLLLLILLRLLDRCGLERIPTHPHPLALL